MKNYKAKIFAWRDGSGWDSHNFANRTAKTVKEVLTEIHQLFSVGGKILIDNGRDYSIEIFCGAQKISEFWLSEYIKNGVVIEGVEYSVR